MEDNHVFMPQIDVVEKEFSFELYADMPGIDSQRLNENVTVELDKGVLHISGKLNATEKECKNSKNEFFRGEFRRNIKFDENVISTEVTGNYSNGVLHITLPKKKEEKKKIEICVA